MNESYFDRERREAKTYELDAFIERNKETLIDQWPELWAEERDVNFYTFRAKGLALPAVVVVLAKRSDVAQRIAEDWCKENAVDESTLSLVITERCEVPAVVHAWNGDY